MKQKNVISVTYSGMGVESEVVKAFFDALESSETIDLFEAELDIELWVCYRLAKLQNMNLKVHSPKGKTTVFTIEA